jgi:deazaflavin-dependent oxidoreductase (nitroreductase family)
MVPSCARAPMRFNPSVAAIPDTVWGSRDSWYARIGDRFVATRLGSWVMRRLVPLDRRIMLRTQGRRSALGPSGAPTLVLETTGRRSGLPRLTPLVFVREGDSVVVLGSNFGRPRHPSWTSNLLAEPRAVVKAGGHDVPVLATLLDGDEAEAAFERFAALSRVYPAYRGRTDRAMRLIRLTPME